MATLKQTRDFQAAVWDYYKLHKRSMPWRETTEPYAIVVSEVMLQQTQVARVMGKYPEFMQAFPDFVSLAKASVTELLQVWQGMGYSRRVLNLQKLAQIVVRDYNGKMPEHPDELRKLPGVGVATAGAIAVYAYNTPHVFIETNIRRVFIYHFFTDKLDVSDTQLLPLVEAALDQHSPRDWYYALMDYGSYLTKLVPNPNRQSRHYAKQSRFEGSDRQARSQILRQLLAGPQIKATLVGVDARAEYLLPALEKEGFVVLDKETYRLP